MRIVIVGNGVAGIEAARTARARAPDATITMVSEESDHFFSRTALMYALSGQLRTRELEPYPRDLYATLRLERVRARAVAIDPETRHLRLGGGLAALPYDRLLIATGSRPRPPPWPGGALAGVGGFVTLQDLGWLDAELHDRLAEAPPRPDAHLATSTADSPYWPRPVARRQRGRTAKSVVVIGGGLIGIEVVETLLARGLRPRFLLRDEWFWPMALSSREAAWIAEALRHHGAEVELQAEVEALEGDAKDCVSAVRLRGGRRLDADAVVVAIGVEPNTAWLAGGPVTLERGAVAVDAGLQTSVPGVFAAGDCAAVPAADGTRRPEQLWYTARDQGRVAGRVLTGEAARYARGRPYNAAKLMDLEYTTVGTVPSARDPSPPGRYREWFFEETGRVRSTLRLVIEGEQVVGVNVLGRRVNTETLLGWLDQGLTLPVVLSRWREASFDTEFVPPLVIPDAARRQPLAPSERKKEAQP